MGLGIVQGFKNLALQYGLVKESGFLTTRGKVVATTTAVAGTAALALPAVATAAAAATAAGVATTFVTLLGKFAIADVVATKIRHPLAALQWKFFGRGGHVPNVAKGLGAVWAIHKGLEIMFPTVAAFSQAAENYALSFHSRANLLLAGKLYLGIIPWVAYDAATNPAHEGHRWEVFKAESLKTLVGSGCCAVVEPAMIDGATALVGPYGSSLVANLVHDAVNVGAYIAVLSTGWRDHGIVGLSEEEKAENGIVVAH